MSKFDFASFDELSYQQIRFALVELVDNTQTDLVTNTTSYGKKELLYAKQTVLTNQETGFYDQYKLYVFSRIMVHNIWETADFAATFILNDNLPLDWQYVKWQRWIFNTIDPITPKPMACKRKLVFKTEKSDSFVTNIKC